MADYPDVIRVIRLRYGYDFTGYAQASLKRRLMRFMGHAGIEAVFDLKHQLINDEAFFTAWCNTSP
ncbi:hypothetical protein MKQ70_06490 [Chitinophaga sedimenti]|uniref:hypothetical protein n=1 Tax=Chitinophaga sedimenti TaxID=2033606 RepID=UPI0020068A94|nr:hypothetical protein [Chitinophaga sedimenti]MCK7554669.1 hypothetical protein [Chitinophaga sedimenti]